MCLTIGHIGEELTPDGARMVFVRVATRYPSNHEDTGAAQVSYSEYWHGVKPCNAGVLPPFILLRLKQEGGGSE